MSGARLGDHHLLGDGVVHRIEPQGTLERGQALGLALLVAIELGQQRARLDARGIEVDRTREVRLRGAEPCGGGCRPARVGPGRRSRRAVRGRARAAPRRRRWRRRRRGARARSRRPETECRPGRRATDAAGLAPGRAHCAPPPDRRPPARRRRGSPPHARCAPPRGARAAAIAGRRLAAQRLRRQVLGRVAGELLREVGAEGGVERRGRHPGDLLQHRRAALAAPVGHEGGADRPRTRTAARGTRPPAPPGRRRAWRRPRCAR